MTGKMLGRLALREWRQGWRANRRWAKGRDERLWRRDLRDEYDHPETVTPREAPYWACGESPRR